ncbi:carbonic anhydrase-related protein-like isoform X2 [Tubulanus polymorphus]|uniref:carbonic anhydrase-related protein-like isoform X2 n=1 Tax=Tubulanus polymorphus TaxID=672921 RepID=UPI003DA4EB9C
MDAGVKRSRYRAVECDASFDVCEFRLWDDDINEQWNYHDVDGAMEWGITFPEANGDYQSPINLNSRTAEYDPNLTESPLVFTYVLCRETDMCNNGHTLVVYLRYKPGDSGYRADLVPKSILSGGPLSPNHEYELAEFRFHWGRENNRGSEHTVNCKAFPMELHLIHYNTTLYHSLEDALGKPDGVTIVAIFIQVGREHEGLKVITENLEDIQHKGRQKTISTAFNPNCLLPDPMLRDFWTYTGSLTIPPCSENVTWIMLRYPLMLSHTQMEEFRRLRTFHKGETPAVGEDGALVDNFRPTQPLNDRIVRASFQ